jgi:tRNA(Ile)-lysidine synthase
MNKADLFNAFQAQLNSILAPQISFDQNFHIALSGGLDSVVLLHLFSRLRAFDKRSSLSAHHINHGLSDNAARWQLFCQNLCTSLAVDFCCSTVILEKKNRTSLEALAREKRYACLTGGLLDNSYLITAHHQDDQLETVLLALKRGSGSTGLQGIQKMQKLHKGYLIRPLLNFSRQQLAAYAELFQLDWVEDESNQDQAFDRNFIRHAITPLLKERWPGMGKAVARSANICQEQQQLLDEIALADFNLFVEFSLNQAVLSVERLATLSTGRRNNLLRFWFKKNHLDYPSAKQLQTLWTDVALANNDAQPVLQFKGNSVRRYRNHLYLVNDNKLAASIAEKTLWQGQDKIALLDGLVELSFSAETDSKSAGNLLNLGDNTKVEICFRSQLPANLTCKPLGRKGARSIKKLLHEHHVAPWLRDLVPFILLDGKLEMAVGLWSCTSEKRAVQPRYLHVSFV